uniref:Uncharacterized protein n=1 Tax=Cacopsylla melanoneura TaxID=428564 RepID=A0A8D9AUQ6_9HEMI
MGNRLRMVSCSNWSGVGTVTVMGDWAESNGLSMENEATEGSSKLKAADDLSDVTLEMIGQKSGTSSSSSAVTFSSWSSHSGLSAFILLKMSVRILSLTLDVPGSSMCPPATLLGESAELATLPDEED